MFKIEEKGEDGKITILQAGKILTNPTALEIVGVILLVAFLGGAFIDWLGFIYLGLAAIFAVLALNAPIIIPTVYFGIPSRFKKRLKHKNDKAVTLKEGINFRWPLVDDLLPENTKSKKLLTQKVVTKALSKDKLEITIEGSVQYWIADLDIHVEMTEKTMEIGMVGAIESELGKICGIKDSDVFVDERTQVEFLIKCVLQLERPPHYYIDEAEEIGKVKIKAKKIKKLIGLNENEIKEADPLNKKENNVMGIVLKEESIEYYEQKFGKSKTKELVKKLSPEKWKLERESIVDKYDKHGIDIIRFYKDNAGRIKLLFTLEADSEVEKLYGINIATFRVEKLNFSKEAQEAFEKERTAVAEMAAAEKKIDKKEGILKRYLELDISADQAVNLTETTAGVEGITRQIVSVEGSKQADLLAFGNLLAKR